MIRPHLFLLGIALLVAGCASSQRIGEADAGQRPPNATETYARQVAPFTVLDAQGQPYTMPFLGGLHVPRPQFVDIDGDGDPDLFVQEQTGSVMFFENAGSPDAPRFLWREDRYRGIDVGEWYRFADFDKDGDYDLLAEAPYSYIRFYRNEGTLQKPHFTVAADTLRDVEGTPIFSDRQNIPNVADIDCDGLLDLFIGRLIGTVTRYEEAGLTENSVPRFRHVTDRFENIEIVAQIGSMHGANTLTFADIDSDGDLDLFWGDFFEPGLLFIENKGQCGAPVLHDEPVPFPVGDPLTTSGYNAPTFTDIDSDADLDLLIGVIGGAYNPNLTASDNLYFYEHTGDGMALRARRYLYGIDVGSETVPALADLDADGDLDLLLANKLDPADVETARIYHFENTGTATQPAFKEIGHLGIEGAFHYAPALGDLDADGDLDMLAGTWNDGITLYRNEGSAQQPRFVAEAPGYITLTRGSNSTPALVDIDGDGDLDLFVGESSGTLNFYRNEGTPQEPAFVLVTDTYGDIDVGRRSYPAFLDLDDDGDFDLVLGTEDGTFATYRNEGTPQEPAFVPAPNLSSRFPSLLPAFMIPAFADIDGDGDADLFVGGVRGGLMFFENRSRPE